MGNVKWTKTGRNDWRAELNGAKLFVSRVIVQRSWAYETPFGRIPGTRKPKRYSSTCLVAATVAVGDEFHRIPRADRFPYTVLMAKADAEALATTLTTVGVNQ